MTFHSITAQRTPASEDRSRPGFRLVVLLWVLYLFSPHKLIQFYLEMARPLTWLLELLLLAGTALFLLTPRAPDQARRDYPAFTIFTALTVLGTGMALVYGEVARSNDALRQMYQFYLLAVLTLAYCGKPERAALILKIYFWHFVYFALWGVISLIRTPIDANLDPGARDIIYWHVHYGNRDAFGPLMAIGLTYSVYYFQAVNPRPKMAAANVVLCLAGVLSSFGRGVFLSLLAAAAMMWLRAKHKIAILVVAAACLTAGAALNPKLVARYTDSMSTIVSEGAEKGTGADRKILWSWALRVFQLNPVAGVGPGNFGIAVFDVVTLQEADKYEYTRNRLYGRVLHSTPMTVLSEYGLLGVLAMLFIITDFFRTNAALRRASTVEDCGFAPGYARAMALALQMAFITVCINSIFYEIMYIAIFWNLITLNRMLYFAAGAGTAALPNPAVLARSLWPRGITQTFGTALQPPARRLPARFHP